MAAALAVTIYGTLALTAAIGLIALAPEHARDTHLLPAVRTLAALLTIAALAAALLH